MITMFITVLGGLLVSDMVISIIKHIKKGKKDVWVSDRALKDIRERYASFDDMPGMNNGMDWGHENIQSDNLRKMEDFRNSG